MKVKRILVISALVFAAEIPVELPGQEAPVVSKQTSRLEELLKRLAGNNPPSLQRDVTGNVVSLTLYRSDISDDNLHLISGLQSVRSLHLQGRADTLTKEGVHFIRQMPNLENLTLACMGRLQSGVFEEVSKLQALRQLTLSQTCPPVEEFGFIARLKLWQLTIDHCEDLSDKQLIILTNISTLKSIELVWTSMSSTGTNFLNYLPAITNAHIVLRDK